MLSCRTSCSTVVQEENIGVERVHTANKDFQRTMDRLESRREAVEVESGSGARDLLVSSLVVVI